MNNRLLVSTICVPCAAMMGLVLGISFNTRARAAIQPAVPVVKTKDLEIVGTDGKIVAELKGGFRNMLTFYSHGFPAVALGVDNRNQPILWLYGYSAARHGVRNPGVIQVGPGPTGVWGITQTASNGEIRELNADGTVSRRGTLPKSVLQNLGAFAKGMRMPLDIPKH